ncbi:MAG: DoxX family protein [Actinomycetota bacterium]|nr:DoxX family protein [Actinomycetota bacterium]
MNTAIWIAQSLLALAMLRAGTMKLSRTKAQLQASGSMDWVEDRTEGQIKGIGRLEVLAALGLILPAVLDVAPVLVAIAAVGVVLLMLGAAATHLGRGERQMVPVNLVIAAIAVFVALMASGPRPSSLTTGIVAISI